MSEAVSGAAIVAEARSWVGTPYHHQACRKGVGVDCLGLIRGVWSAFGGEAAGQRQTYTRDWADASGNEAMLDGARRNLIEVRAGDMRPGDVLVFRLRAGFVAKHAAILTDEARIIHAMEGCLVSEVALSSWWRRRIAGVFRFPQVMSGE